jgi:tRNA splicing ligase
MEIDLKGFCSIQKQYWYKLKEMIEADFKCLKCKGRLKMISKWCAVCTACKEKHTIKKPKSFPHNSFDKSKWKRECVECGGVMDYHENSFGGGAYICNKCNSIFEV